MSALSSGYPHFPNPKSCQASEDHNSLTTALKFKPNFRNITMLKHVQCFLLLDLHF